MLYDLYHLTQAPSTAGIGINRDVGPQTAGGLAAQAHGRAISIASNHM
jgi:hypothetical protein